MRFTKYTKQSPSLANDGFEENDQNTKEFITNAVEHLFNRIAKRGVNNCYHGGCFGMRELSKYSVWDRELYRMSNEYWPSNYTFFTEDLYWQAKMEYRLREYYRIAFKQYFLYGKIKDEVKMEFWKWYWVTRFNRIFNELDLISKVKDNIFDWYESLPNPEFKDIYWSDEFDKIDTFNFGKFKLYDPEDFPLEVLFMSFEDGINYEKSMPRLYPIYDEKVLSQLKYVYGHIKFAHRSENFGFIQVKPESSSKKSKSVDIFFHKDDFVYKMSSTEMKKLAQEKALLKFKILGYQSYSQIQEKAVRIEIVEDKQSRGKDYKIGDEYWIQDFCDFTISKMMQDSNLNNMVSNYFYN